MSDNIDLKSLWSQQPAGPKPDINEVIKKAGRLKSRFRTRLLFTNICLMATVIFVCYIGISSQFAMVTTKIGIILIVISLVAFVAVSNGLLYSLFKSNPDADSRTYLTELLAIRKKQEYLQGKILTLYFILLSLSFAFYMIEFLLRMTVLWGSVSFIITFGWIALNWFYIRPKTVKKQQRMLNEMIAKLEAVNAYYQNEEL